jgi:PAS domain S-box-containing protein
MMPTTTRVLLIAADSEAVARIRASLGSYHGGEEAEQEGRGEDGSFQFEHVVTLEAGLAHLAASNFDLVIADLELPDAHGLQVFALLSAHAPELPLVVLVDRDHELLALKAVQHGAQDYILKDQVHGGLVARAAQHAVQYRATEEALARERERLAVTLRSIGEGVITTDTNGDIVLINRVAEELTGWTQEEGAGRSLTDVFRIVDEETSQSRENPVEQVLAGGQATEFEAALLIGRTGRQLLIEASGAPIRDREGAISGVVLAFRDVTSRRQLQEERIRSGKLESIGKLAGGIAHDFNNLLVGILGHLSLAREESATDSTILELLDAAETATLRARDLARQLLTFASGGAPIKTVASVQGLVAVATRLALSGSNVRADLSLPEDLWPVEVDEAQFSQAITHLVRNARQAMADGGMVSVRGENFAVESSPSNAPALVPEAGVALEPGRYLRISIEDNGCGIPADTLSLIFDPYFTTRQGASGLGLSISYSIVTRHDGRITAHSQPGRGSTFQIYLPAAVPRAESPLAAATVAEGAGEGEGPWRVLLMDDDDMVRQVASRMLERLGYAVVTARDGAEAIGLYHDARKAGNPFHLAIMDLTIPGGMGGKEAIRQLREIAPEIKAIVSSGYFNDPVMASFREHGFDGVIAKPYQLENLRDALKAVLGSH